MRKIKQLQSRGREVTKVIFALKKTCLREHSSQQVAMRHNTSNPHSFRRRIARPSPWICCTYDNTMSKWTVVETGTCVFAS